MSERNRMRWSWLFVAVVVAAGGVLAVVDMPVMASGDDDHEHAREYLESGQAMPLTQLLSRPELAGRQVLEAELEHEHGRLVYELELLGDDGRVDKRYFDAASGEPVQRARDD